MATLIKQNHWLFFAFLALFRFDSARAAARNAEAPFLKSEIIFPLEVWHNHASCIVETPHGDLLVCWFHGSGERNADDGKIDGAGRHKGSRTWRPPFTLADT